MRNRLAAARRSLFLYGVTVLPVQAQAPTTQIGYPGNRIQPQIIEAPSAIAYKPSQLEPSLTPLPINLATALCLSGARPLVVQAAQASLEAESARWQQSRVLWLPNVTAGADYQRAEGGRQGAAGAFSRASTQQALVGGGAAARFALTDAIYSPLAERQLVQARQANVQTAHNDALLDTAAAFFAVQDARGRLAALEDAHAKANELIQRLEKLTKGISAPIEVERARTAATLIELDIVQARLAWRVASASLGRVLRLNPGAVLVPMEPPHLQVRLLEGKESVDDLIAVALTSRPELASQQAVVQATLVRLRQEKMRPLIPSLVLQGNSTPGQTLGGGYFVAGRNDYLGNGTGKLNLDAQVIWEFRNLGLGNRGLVRERQAQQQQEVIELFRIQDTIAEEVVRRDAELETAAKRISIAEAGLKIAVASYEGNLKGLGETVRLGETLQLLIRPQEVVSALSQVQQQTIAYFTAVNDYNAAQFRLFRALGHPSSLLQCNPALGAELPIDTARPAMRQP